MKIGVSAFAWASEFNESHYETPTGNSRTRPLCARALGSTGSGCLDERNVGVTSDNKPPKPSKAALAEHFYAIPSDKQLSRLVTLLTTTLRRCRYRVGLIELLRDPEAHADYLIDSVVKRVELDRLPGAPVPTWQGASNRGDVSSEYQAKTPARARLPGDATADTVAAEERNHRAIRPVTGKIARPFKHNGQPLPEEILIDAMAN
jgi:hypothetical protein